MNKTRCFCFVIIFFSLYCCKKNNMEKEPVDTSNVSYEAIIGKWYRNLFSAEAALTINNDMTFTIEAMNNANSGGVTGKLTKIKDGYYFSHIIDESSLASCVIIFIENSKYIELIVYGNQVNAGGGVYYDGIYEPAQWTKDERIEIALNSIIEDYFDKNTLKQLLKDDMEYFTECFSSFIINDDDNKIIIEGWLRGVAPWQNGIIKIENKNIYILITDCRDDDLIFRYYSTDKKQNNIPEEFTNWHYYKDNIKITGF